MNKQDKEQLREILQAFLSAESRCRVAKEMIDQPSLVVTNIEQALLACGNAVKRMKEMCNG